MSMRIARASASFLAGSVMNGWWGVFVVASIDVLGLAFAAQFMTTEFAESVSFATSACTRIGTRSVIDVVVSVGSVAATEIGVGNLSMLDAWWGLFVSPILGVTAVHPALEEHDVSHFAGGSRMQQDVAGLQFVLADGMSDISQSGGVLARSQLPRHRHETRAVSPVATTIGSIGVF